MLLSRKLLESLFPVFKEISNEVMEKTLLSIGCEIESSYTFDKIDNLVVGLIVEVKKHPKSDKLNICVVEIDGKRRTIVCGANNVRPKAKVIVALENAKMIDGRVIQYKELLGIVSEGMICAYNELTNRVDFLSDIDKDNIIILDDNAIIGDTNPLKYIHFDDTIYDISIPSNRNELNGVIALAYDLISIIKPKYKFDYDFNFSKIQKNNIKINKQDSDCTFFGTIKISNVKVDESSWTVKSYLMNSGIKPINSMVDISNLVMVLTSNPTHAYDEKYIFGEMTINESKESVKLLGLDNNEYELPKNSIVVRSNNKIISMAGIMGLKDSSIQKDTKNVVFEIANFNNKKISRTSKEMNLKTSASNLFSKEIPLWITLNAFQTMINLLLKSKSKFEGISYTPYKINKIEIKLNYDHLSKILGIKTKNELIRKTLLNMGFEINDLSIFPPLHRVDIKNINDVAEELLKVLDINKIEPVPIQTSLINLDINNIENSNINFIQNYFINRGFSLVKTYNLISKEFDDKYNIFNSKNKYEIINPISKDRKYLRTSIIGQLVNVYGYNNSYKNDLIPIFEIQKLNYDFNEKIHLSLLLDNKYFLNSINKSYLTVDLFFLKSLIVDFYKQFNKEIYFSDNFVETINCLIKSNSLLIKNKNNETIGFLGQLNPNYAKEQNISDKDLFFIEIIIDDLISSKSNKDFLINKISSNTHDIYRSLSFVLENQKIIDLIKIINECNYITNFDIKDVFIINKEENIVSYNIEFTLKKEEENISLDKINNVFSKMISYFEKNGFKIKK